MLIDIYDGWKGTLDYELLKRRRIQMGLTQRALGDMFLPPMNHSVICQWERGTALPSLARFKQLCLILQVEPTKMLGLGSITISESGE